MAILESEAIVLRSMDYSETSLIVWLFTRDHGRVHVIAKGARRARSPFEGALEPLVRGELVFYRKRGGDGLDIAKEFDPQDLHLGLRRDLPRLYRGLYLAELLTELSEREAPAPAAYDAAVRALAGLARGELGQIDQTLVRAELELFAAAGLAPSLERCAACGAAAPGAAAFSAGAGGVLCADDARRTPDAVAVAAGALKTLRALAAGEAIGVGREVGQAMRGLLDAFVRQHLGKEPRLLGYVRRTLGAGAGPRRAPGRAVAPGAPAGGIRG